MTDSIHYSDDNDQQMVVVLGNYGFRLPVLHNRAFLQLDLGGGWLSHYEVRALPQQIVPTYISATVWASIYRNNGTQNINSAQHNLLSD